MTDSQRIKAIEEFTELSTRCLASTLGLKTPQTLYDILKGKHGISKAVAAAVQSKYLNINPEWLLTGNGEMLKSDISDVKKADISTSLDTQQMIEWLKDKDDIIKSKDVEIKELREQINYYRSELERLKIAIVNSDDATLKKEIAV